MKPSCETKKQKNDELKNKIDIFGDKEKNSDYHKAFHVNLIYSQKQFFKTSFYERSNPAIEKLLNWCNCDNLGHAGDKRDYKCVSRGKELPHNCGILSYLIHCYRYFFNI